MQVYGPEGVRTSRRHYQLLGLRGTLGPLDQPLINGLPWDSADALTLVKAAAGDDAWVEASAGPERFDVLPLLVATDGAVEAFGRDVRRLRPNILIGGVVPFGASSLKASYGKVTSNGTDRDATQIAVGYQYDLSKRTAIYATVSSLNNDGAAVGGAVFTIGQGPAQTRGGDSSKGYNLGVRHSF